MCRRAWPPRQGLPVQDTWSRPTCISSRPQRDDPSICSTKCQSGCNFGTDGEPSHLPTRAITALREGGKNMCGAGVAEHVGSVEPWGPPQPVSDFENLKRSRNRGRSGSDRLHQRPPGNNPVHQTQEATWSTETGKNPGSSNFRKSVYTVWRRRTREISRSFSAPLFPAGGGEIARTCTTNRRTTSKGTEEANKLQGRDCLQEFFPSHLAVGPSGIRCRARQ